MTDDYIYILYSDGTWSAISKKSNLTAPEDRIQKRIDSHWWPFPLDIKGDYRREVTIIHSCTNVQVIKGV